MNHYGKLPGPGEEVPAVAGEIRCGRDAWPSESPSSGIKTFLIIAEV